MVCALVKTTMRPVNDKTMVTHSPPISEVSDSNPEPSVGKLVVA